MVLRRIQWYLETHAKLSPMQTTFRPHLRQKTLLLLHKEILEQESTCDSCVVVAIDVAKDFDSVPHEAVIDVLNVYLEAEHYT